MMIGGAVGAAVLLAVGWRLWRRNDPAAPLAGGFWSTAVWLTVGFAALHWLMLRQFEDPSGLPLNSLPGLPLRNYEFWHWPFYIALGLLPLALLESLGGRPGPLRYGLIWLGRLVCIGGALYFALNAVLNPADPFHPEIQPPSMLATVGFLTLWTVPIFALVALLDPLAERRPGAMVPLGLWVVAAASSGCFLGLGQIPLALSAGALAIALGGLVVLAWLQPVVHFSRGAVLVVLTVLGCQWGAAMYLTPTPGRWMVLGLMVVSLGALWLRELPWIARCRPWLAALIVLVLVAVPAGTATGLANRQAAQQHPPEDDPYAKMLGARVP